MSCTKLVKHLTVLSQIRIKCGNLRNFMTWIEVLWNMRQIGIGVKSWSFIVSVQLKKFQTN